jgi:hypothetical protein
MKITKQKLSPLDFRLVTALANGHHVDDLLSRFPDHEQLINDALVKLRSLAGFQSDEEIERDCADAGKVEDECQGHVAEQDFVKAATARDRLDKEYKYGHIIHNLDRANAIDALAAELESQANLTSDALSLLVEAGSAPPDDIGALLSELSKLYRMVGGSGITFVPTEIRNPEVMS